MVNPGRTDIHSRGSRTPLWPALDGETHANHDEVEDDRGKSTRRSVHHNCQVTCTRHKQTARLMGNCELRLTMRKFT